MEERTPVETIFPSAKSELGAHRFYDESVSDKLDTPVKVQAEILRRLISAARERTGEDPRRSKVVITVPASFEMGQRKDTLEAAKLAGLIRRSSATTLVAPSQAVSLTTQNITGTGFRSA
jgi:molecular chaperone DnaK (HSP70)